MSRKNLQPQAKAVPFPYSETFKEAVAHRIGGLGAAHIRDADIARFLEIKRRQQWNDIKYRTGRVPARVVWRLLRKTQGAVEEFFPTVRRGYVTGPAGELPRVAEAGGEATAVATQRRRGARGPRYKLRLPALLDPGGRAVIQNIGLAGAAAEHREQLRPGDDVTVLVKLPRGRVQARGIVIWCQPAAVGPARGRGVRGYRSGILFRNGSR